MKGISWATLVSIGVHGALMTAVAYAPDGWFDRAMSIDPISFTLIAPDESIEESPEPEAEEPDAPEAEELLPEQPRLAASTVIREQVGPIEPSNIDPSMLDPDSVPSSAINVPSVSPDHIPSGLTPEQERRRIQAMLAPGAVARGGFHATGPGPSQRGRPAGLQAIGPGHMTEHEAETLHNGHLRAAAMAKRHITREEPDLRPQPDGSYRYAGPRMSATIRPDGEVVFEHQGNVQSNGFSASGTFDATDAIMGASGQNPHQGEEDWFMRRTAELRARLETEHRRTAMSSGLRRLHGRLAGIWNNSSRGGYTRRRALFRIWDEMADDDTGTAARRIVMTFIRDTLPAGSEEAFTDHEIERLNASRESTERFAPY